MEDFMNNIMKRDHAAAKTGMVSVFDHLLAGDIDRLFSDDYWGFKGLSQHATAPVNIRETDSAYEVEMYAPGMDKKDFTIDLNGDDLTISANKENEQKQEGQNYIRQEFSQRSIRRSFHLDHTIDRNSINARYENGILKLILTKKEEAKKITRTIEIG